LQGRSLARRLVRGNLDAGDRGAWDNRPALRSAGGLRARGPDASEPLQRRL